MSATRLVLIFSAALLAACFHATVETGAPPATQVVQKDWASGWLFGLVPPSPISTASACPNGVSKVETQQTFLNGLVHILTVGIYTPLAIKATCASGPVAPSAGAEAAPSQ